MFKRASDKRQLPKEVQISLESETPADPKAQDDTEIARELNQAPQLTQRCEVIAKALGAPFYNPSD